MTDIKTFWHISEYTLTNKMRKTYVTFGDWSDIKEKLEKKNVKFTITVIKPKDFKNFRPLKDI